MESEKYADLLRKIIAHLEEDFSPEGKDRLAMMAQLRTLTINLRVSIDTWIQWFRNLALMASFSEDELAEMLIDLKDASLFLLHTDMKWTEVASKVPKREKVGMAGIA